MAQTVADISVRATVPVREVDRRDGQALIDENARYYLGISGEEFVRRWDRGDYEKSADDSGVMLVASLLPFIR